MTATSIVLLAGVAVGLYMAWNIGANDVANAMGTSVGSGAVTLMGAVLIAAVFAALCRGRTAVWEGYVSGRRGLSVQIKMTPGRERARADLVLDLIDEPEPPLVKIGRKVRFAGTVAERGDPARPDRLAQARILGPGLLTADERERALRVERDSAVAACSVMIEALFRTTHAPDWTVALRREAEAGGRPPPRFFYLVGRTSEPELFTRAPGGDWQGRVEGFVTIQNVRSRMLSTIEFAAACTVDADHASFQE